MELCSWDEYPRRSVTFSNIPPWVFHTFFNGTKWYQIAKSVTYDEQFCSKAFQTTKLRKSATKSFIETRNVLGTFSNMRDGALLGKCITTISH